MASSHASKRGDNPLMFRNVVTKCCILILQTHLIVMFVSCIKFVKYLNFP